MTSRLLCYHALAAMDRGERANGVSAMAKRYAVSACDRAIALAMQVHGAMGLSREVGLERMARDVRMLSIPDGTPEILALIQGAKSPARTPSAAEPQPYQELSFITSRKRAGRFSRRALPPSFELGGLIIERERLIAHAGDAPDILRVGIERAFRDGNRGRRPLRDLTAPAIDFLVELVVRNDGLTRPKAMASSWRNSGGTYTRIHALSSRRRCVPGKRYRNPDRPSP